MSAFKGTPGPWFAGKQCDFSGWVEIRVPGYSRNPVAAATPATAGDAEARRDSETLANARLIASSPVLLGSAQQALEALANAYRLRPEYDDDRIYDEMPSELAAAFFALREAVKRATGGDA